MISQKQMQRVTVCCGFWAGIIGLYFENKAGQTAIVNDARYRDTITRFFPPKLDVIDVVNICGFNKTMPHAIQSMKRFNYRTRHFLVVYSLVSAIRTDPLDRAI